MRLVRGADTLARMTTNGAEDLFDDRSDRAGYVRTMFGEISGRYDVVNRLMTLGRDQAWRRLAAKELVRPGDRIVDVGCGTGDQSFACRAAGARAVIGVDFARPMLDRARAKALHRADDHTEWLQGDATRLPLRDASVDGWCSAFVVRNIPDLDAALSEARRVLKPAGRLAVLELPRMVGGWQRPFARAHFRRVVPLLGRAVTGHASAYTYLPVSVDHFLSPPEFSQRLTAAGFRLRTVRMLMLGTVALHVAEKV